MLSVAEDQIRIAIQKFKLENVLLGLWKFHEDYLPFQIAGTACFAIRFCTGGHFTNDCQHLTRDAINQLIGLVTGYLVADPIGSMETEVANKQHPFIFLLRIVGNQFVYSKSLYGNFAQPFLLYEQIPQELYKDGNDGTLRFDIKHAIRETCGTSLEKFIIVGLIAHVAASKKGMFTREYFEIARTQKIKLIPSAQEISSILNKMTADPRVFQKEYEKYRVTMNGFEIYSPNPLHNFPIIRPWRKKGTELNDFKSDRFIIPLPDLIAQRISNGIYHQLLTKYSTDFTECFGTVFESYVGKVLKQSISSEQLISEKQIRQTFSTGKGKAVDWVILHQNTAILIECKATRINRQTLKYGNEEDLAKNLRQMMGGLRQLYEFRASCQNKMKGLELFHNITRFIPLLITFDSLYMINSQMSRDYLDQLLHEDTISKFDWLILSVQELEALQPHFSGNVHLAEVLEELSGNPFNDILENLVFKTGKTYKDSFLYRIDEDLFNRMGFPSPKRNI